MAEKTDEADALRADLHAAEAAKKGLDADLAKAVQRAEKAEADLGGVVAKMEKAQADLGVARDELAKTKADLAVAVKARGDAEASLEAAVADARLQKRTAAVAAAMRLGPDDEAVKSLVDDLDEVSDAKFASALARLAPRPSAASIENADPKNLEAAVASASVGASPSPSGPDDDVELEQAIASYLDDSMGDNK